MEHLRTSEYECAESKGKGKKVPSGKGKGKGEGRGKGKGKGVGNLSRYGKCTSLSEILMGGQRPFYAEADACMGDSTEGSDMECDGCGDVKGITTAQRLALPLLTELWDVVLAAQSGQGETALIPRIQDILAHAKRQQSQTFDDSVADVHGDNHPMGELIHATKYDCWEAIKTEGLKGSASVDFVEVDAKSKRGCIAGVMAADLLIYVNLKKACQDGIRFSRHPTKPDTIMCHASILPITYFSKVVDIRSGELMWDASHGGSVKDAEFTTQRLRQMKLYSNSRIRYTLHKAVEIAYANGKSLKCSDFGFMDQLHYLGTEGIDDFFGRFAPHLRNSAAPIIDIGTGLGGTARYMWEQYGARVTGIEYQPEMAKIFSIMSRLLHIPKDQLHVEQGDFAHMDLAYLGLESQFAAFTSQLVFLHIADKESLFEKCGQSLQDGGCYMIEDYFLLDGTTLTEDEKRMLAEDVSVPGGVSTYESKYRDLLTSNGLVIDEWVDITDRWTIFIWERCEAFLGARATLEEQHGKEYVQEQAHFFAVMTLLYHKMPAGERVRFPLVSQHVRWEPTMESRPQTLRGVRVFGHKEANASL